VEKGAGLNVEFVRRKEGEIKGKVERTKIWREDSKGDGGNLSWEGGGEEKNKEV